MPVLQDMSKTWTARQFKSLKSFRKMRHPTHRAAKSADDGKNLPDLQEMATFTAAQQLEASKACGWAREAVPIQTQTQQRAVPSSQRHLAD